MTQEFVMTKRWDENILKGGHRVAIRTDAGFLPFEVIDNDIVDFNLYWDERVLNTGIPAGTLTAIPAPGIPPSLIPGIQDYIIPRDVFGKEYLYIEEKANLIAQIFIGISDPDIKIWYRYPQSVARKQLQNSIGGNTLFPGAVGTKYFGWLVNGEESTFEAPTVRGEFFQLPQQSIEFGVMNNSLRVIDLITCFKINYLTVEPLNKEQPEDMELIKSILLHKIPSRTWSPGLEAFHYGLAEKNFKIKPVKGSEVGLYD